MAWVALAVAVLADSNHHVLSVPHMDRRDISAEEANRRAELGRWGEQIASDFLAKEKGFLILDRNWKSKYHYELDIVALGEGRLHFVEVKTRLAPVEIDPILAITRTKLAKIMQGARLYKKYRRLEGEDTIDGISIIVRSRTDYDFHFYPDIHLRTLH